MRSAHAPIALLASIGAAMLSGCAHAQQAAQQGLPPAAVTVAKAQHQNIATFVTLNGQITPLLDSTLAFQQSGPVSAVYVNVGDRVRKGQLLAAIDASTLHAQLAQSQAAVAQAAARARSSQVNIPINRSQTGAAIQAAKAAMDNSKLVYDQDERLYKQGYVSLTMLEQARSAYVQASSQYRAAVANDQSNQATQLNAQADLAAEHEARAQVETLRTEIAQTSLYAPFDGVVTARSMDPGAMAGPNTSVLRISAIDTVWLNVNIPDEDLRYARPETMVSFVTPSLPGHTFRARVGPVNAVPAQGTLSYQAQVRVANPGDLLRGGMLVSVSIPKARHPDAIVVPRDAVVDSPQGASVFVVAGGHATAVPVTVGLQTDRLTEVSSPKVASGTLVVISPPQTLQSGGAVIAAQPAQSQQEAAADPPGHAGRVK
ncbi:MAG: efflux RND transporter periplasmic adaptor subunit [bacterium]|nr:efflux RND transporter periplasmic adaptor subunit [bacterium]